MKNSKLFCGVIFSAIILSAQGFEGHPFMGHGRMGMGHGHMGMESRTPVTGAPYSAVETFQSQRVLENGNQITRNVQTKVFRDGQGRTRRERTITPSSASGKQPFTEITIVDPVAGYRYVLNSSNMTAFRMKLRQPRTGGPQSSETASGGTRTVHNGAQISTTDLGTQTINGVPATGKQITETIPAGAIGNQQPIQSIRTIWTSTALKVPVQVKFNDPRFGTMDRELTNIVQAEPDASLFVVPSSYTVKEHQFGPGEHHGHDEHKQ
jgi:hypothetical protein